MNGSSFLPEVKLPKLYVADISKSSLWENASYIPGASNVKGFANILEGTVGIVASLTAAVFVLTIIVPIQIARDIQAGNQVFGPINEQETITPFSTFFAKKVVWELFVVQLAGEFVSILARGIIESIPVAGNIALGFWDGKIKIIPQQ